MKSTTSLLKLMWANPSAVLCTRLTSIMLESSGCLRWYEALLLGFTRRLQARCLAVEEDLVKRVYSRLGAPMPSPSSLHITNAGFIAEPTAYVSPAGYSSTTSLH